MLHVLVTVLVRHQKLGLLRHTSKTPTRYLVPGMIQKTAKTTKDEGSVWCVGCGGRSLTLRRAASRGRDRRQIKRAGGTLSESDRMFFFLDDGRSIFRNQNRSFSSLLRAEARPVERCTRAGVFFFCAINTCVLYFYFDSQSVQW